MIIFLLYDFILLAKRFCLVVELALKDSCKLLGQDLALGEAIDEDQVNHANIGVKDSLKYDATLNALHRDLPRDLLNGNVVRDLNQQVRVGLLHLALVALLSWERSLRTVPCCVTLAPQELRLNHIDGALEPLGEEYGVLSTAWLAQVALRESGTSRLILQGLLEPVRSFFLVVDARLSQLVGQVAHRL